MHPTRLYLDYAVTAIEQRGEGGGRRELRKGPRSVHVPCTRLDYDQRAQQLVA